MSGKGYYVFTMSRCLSRCLMPTSSFFYFTPILNGFRWDLGWETYRQ